MRTPRGDVVDEGLLQLILMKICGVVVDGADLKTAESMHMSLMRDLAHVSKATCRDPFCTMPLPFGSVPSAGRRAARSAQGAPYVLRWAG